MALLMGHGEWAAFLLLSAQTNHRNGGSYPEEQLTLNRSGLGIRQIPKSQILHRWATTQSDLRLDEAQDLSTCNHLQLLPGISLQTTVDFGAHIFLKQPFDFSPSLLPWHC